MMPDLPVTDAWVFVTLEEVKTAPAKPKKSEAIPSKSDKAEKFEAVAYAIFKILLSGGPQNITHSAVSRSSGVSRAWLYKYIGKSPEDLVNFSLDAIGKQFAKMEELSWQTSAAEVRKSLVEGTFRMMDDAAKEPALLALYYRYAGTDNVIGQKIHEIEHAYNQLVQQRMEKYFSLPSSEARVVAEVLQGLRMGLAHRFAVLQFGSKSQKIADHAAIQKSLQRILKHFLSEIGSDPRPGAK